MVAGVTPRGREPGVMQWLCPKCQRPVSVHLSRCPYCETSPAEPENPPGSRPDTSPPLDPASPAQPPPANPSADAGAPRRPLSAIDVISPAFKRTVARLFHPWRWACWLRYALLCIATGGFAGFGGTGATNLNLPRRQLAMGATGMFQSAVAPAGS